MRRYTTVEKRVVLPGVCAWATFVPRLTPLCSGREIGVLSPTYQSAVLVDTRVLGETEDNKKIIKIVPLVLKNLVKTGHRL